MNVKQIQQSIEEGDSLKVIAQAYSEIASIKLKKIRFEVERNRAFLNEIGNIFRIVNYVAVQKNIKEAVKSKKAVSLVLTSNYRFYGNINLDLVSFFKIKSATIPTDKIVVGRTGADILKTSGYIHSYKVYLPKKDLPDLSDLKSLAQEISEYSQVLVYYSQFKTVLTQQPTLKDITQTPILTHRIELNKELYLPLTFFTKSGLKSSLEYGDDFIFEPEISKMLTFFETQIKILLLEQTFLESELARTASRMISMDQAQTNAQDFIKDQNKLLASAKRSVQNIRLLDTFAGLVSYQKKQ